MYFCSSFLSGNRNYSSFCCERLWFNIWTWLFKIWASALNPAFFILCLYNGHPYSYARLCLFGWAAGCQELPLLFHPPHLWAHLPATGFLWGQSNRVAHCRDQIRQQDCNSSRLPVGAGLFSSDVMSRLIHASAVRQRGEGGCDLTVCGCGFQTERRALWWSK